MSVHLLCPAVPGDRCFPATADRTAQILSAGQKRVTNQASISFKYNYETCSALEMFLQLIHARTRTQVNVTAIDRAVSFAQYSNITVNGRCSLFSSSLRPTQSAIRLTSARDTLFEPH